MTPNDIDVLLHCHCCPGEHPRIGAPAVDGAIEMLFGEGLIERSGEHGCYATTEKGRAHVRQICNLPFPQRKWFGHDGNIIPD